MRRKENKLRIQGTTMRRKENKLPLQKKGQQLYQIEDLIEPFFVKGACYPMRRKENKLPLQRPTLSNRRFAAKGQKQYAFKSFGFNKLVFFSRDTRID